MAEELIDAVLFICPVCKYEVFIYQNELQSRFGFDGKNFNKLPKLDCFSCLRSKASAKEIKKVPDIYIDPADMWF